VPISVTTIFVYNDTIFRSLWWRYNQVLLYLSEEFWLTSYYCYLLSQNELKIRIIQSSIKALNILTYPIMTYIKYIPLPGTIILLSDAVCSQVFILYQYMQPVGWSLTSLWSIYHESVSVFFLFQPKEGVQLPEI
jgi:hypothetical protein